MVPPGDEAAWTLGAFSGEVKDGFLYGRGAVDMKGGIACSVAAVLQYLADHGGKPKGSISFLITGDEEDISVNGTIKLLNGAAEQGERFDHAWSASLVECRGARRLHQDRPPRLANRYALCRRRAGPRRLSAPCVQPGAGYFTVIAALSDEPLDQGSRSFRLPISNYLRRRRQYRQQRDPRPGARKVQHPLQRQPHSGDAACTGRGAAGKRRGNRIHARIVWEYSNSNAFVTKPGDLTDLAGALEAETGRRPALYTSGGTSDARFVPRYCPVIEFGLVGHTMHQINERTPVCGSGKADQDLSGRAG